MNSKEIICINDLKPNPDIFKLFKNWIEKDKIYTIRKIQQNLNGDWGVLLEELQNNSIQIFQGFKSLGYAEPGYNLERFRYLDNTPLKATLEQEENLIKSN